MTCKINYVIYGNFKASGRQNFIFMTFNQKRV